MPKLDSASYIAGLIDGEGTINCYKTKTGHSCRISIANTDLSIVDACCSALKELNIPYSIYTAQPKKLNHKPYYRIDIRGGYRSYAKVRDIIPIQCKRKIENLEKVLLSRKWRIMPERDWFYEHYHNQQKSISEIADSLQCAPMTVYHWLKKYQITRRPLSSAGRIDWAKRGFRRRHHRAPQEANNAVEI